MGGLPASPKMWTFPFCWISPHSKIEFLLPCPEHRPHIEKKVSLIAFRQILPKILSVACIFSYTNMTYLKKLDETKSLNTKQCVAGLSSRITTQVSPFLPKVPPPLIVPFCTNHVWTVPPFPWTFMGNSGVGGKGEWGWGFYPTTKNFLISPTIKIPLHAFTSSAIKNVIPSLSNSKFHVITLCKLHL